MHTIQVFLASSITEFEMERIRLGDFVRTLNDILIRRDLYIRLEKSEDISNAVDPFRKQNQYNEVIRSSQYFFMLIGSAVGSYTMEEYLTACRSEKAGIRILFDRKKSEVTDSPVSADRADLPDAGAAMTPALFRDRLEEEKRTYQSFDNLDSARLALLMMLTREKEIAQCLMIHDGQALLDGETALSLMDTPIYQKDDALREKILRKQELEREYAQMFREEEAAGKSSTRKKELLEQIGALEGEIRQQEAGILAVFEYINQNQLTGDRERTAQRYLAEGDLAAAAEILRDPLREAERGAAEERILRLRAQIERKMQRSREEVLSLLGGRIGPPPADSAGIRYLAEMLLEENARLARTYLTGFTALYDYALWKQQTGNIKEAARLVKLAEDYYDLYGMRLEDWDELMALREKVIRR